MSVTVSNFSPGIAYFTLGFPWMLHNITESNNSTYSYKTGVHFEVLLYSFIPMIAVDKKEIQLSASKNLLEYIKSSMIIRVLSQQVNSLLSFGERSVEKNFL